MNEHEMYDYDLNCGDHEYVVYRGGQRGGSARYVPPSHGCRHIADGLRVIDCFFPRQRTLTKDEISDLLDLPERQVTQHAVRLVDLGYLRVVPSEGEGAWTLIDVDGAW